MGMEIKVDYWETRKLLNACGFLKDCEIGVFLKQAAQKVASQMKHYDTEAVVQLPNDFLKRFGIEAKLTARVSKKSLVSITQ